MTPDEMIEVIQGREDGKTVEYQAKFNDDSWMFIHPNHEFNFQIFIYRLKPDPRVIYVNEYKSGYCWGSGFASKEKAVHAGLATGGLIATRKFVEVME